MVTGSEHVKHEFCHSELKLVHVRRLMKIKTLSKVLVED